MSAFIDTSVLVRYFMGDAPKLSKRAKQIVDGQPLTLTPVVLAEVAFVLTTFYRVPREVAVAKLIELLGKENIEVAAIGKDNAIGALLLCRPSRRVSFADALLWAEARAMTRPAQKPLIYSFDKRFPGDGVTLSD